MSYIWLPHIRLPHYSLSLSHREQCIAQSVVADCLLTPPQLFRSAQVHHFRAAVDNLRMATRYSFHIRPVQPRRLRSSSARSEFHGENDIEGAGAVATHLPGQSIIIPTKGCKLYCIKLATQTHLTNWTNLTTITNCTTFSLGPCHTVPGACFRNWGGNGSLLRRSHCSRWRRLWHQGQCQRSSRKVYDAHRSQAMRQHGETGDEHRGDLHYGPRESGHLYTQHAAVSRE